MIDDKTLDKIFKWGVRLLFLFGLCCFAGGVAGTILLIWTLWEVT